MSSGSSEPEDTGSMTINEDGSPVKIEGVFYQHHAVYAEEFDSIEEAIAFLNSGEDYGSLLSVGVFVDGEPKVAGQYLSPHPPTADEAAGMLKDYGKIS